MRVGDICTKNAVTVTASTRVRSAAETMRDEHVGDVVVTKDDKRLPIGILTDRDIVLALASRGDDALGDVPVGEIMTKAVIVASEHDEIDEVLSNMKANGVRRVPVIDRRDDVIGVLAYDDLVAYYSKQLATLSKVVGAEIARETTKGS